MTKKVKHYGQADGYHVEQWESNDQTPQKFYSISRYSDNDPEKTVITQVLLTGPELVAISILAIGASDTFVPYTPVAEGDFNNMHYKIMQLLGTLRPTATGNLLFTFSKFDDRPPYYDIRVWSKDMKSFEKGIGLTEESFGKLLEIIVDVISKEHLYVPRFKVNTVGEKNDELEPKLCQMLSDLLIMADKAYIAADKEKVKEILKKLT